MTAIEHSKARLAFEAEMVDGVAQPRRGMVFRRVFVDDHGSPSHFTCRGEVGEGRWADPTWPRADEGSFLRPANAVATKGWAFDGVDPAYTDTPDDIALFGISPHADLAGLAKRIAESEEALRRQHDVLMGSPELIFRPGEGLKMAGPMVAAFAAAHEAMLVESGAKNFLLLSFHSKRLPGEKILVTMRRSTGATVEDKWSERERQVDQIRSEWTAKRGAPSPCEAEQGFATGLARALEILGVDLVAAPDQLPSGRTVGDMGCRVRPEDAPDDAGPTSEESDPPSEEPSEAALPAFLALNQSTGDMCCDHCGAREPFPFPVPLAGVTAALKPFADKHRDCPAPPVGRVLSDLEDEIARRSKEDRFDDQRGYTNGLREAVRRLRGGAKREPTDG